MEITGLLSYAIFFVTFAGIYSVVVLGLNVQWGFTGLFNIGIAAFFGVGAYASAIVTTGANPHYLGGFAMPWVAGAVAAMFFSGLIAFFIGIITLRLRTDYLAIASIGIAEILRLAFKNEEWLTNGVRGISEIPTPLAGLTQRYDDVVYMVFVLAVIVIVYVLLERAYRSPWGRVQRAIRENETAAMAIGKNTLAFRLQSFVLGSTVMGLGGALYGSFVNFISPEAFLPEFATFLPWVMLIAGGAANNRGAILGTYLIWLVWAATEYVLTNTLPEEWSTRAGALRVFLIGLILVLILVFRPEGILPEKRPRLPARARR